MTDQEVIAKYEEMREHYGDLLPHPEHEPIKEYDMMMKEVEDAMNEFRTSKKDIDEKKNKAKELIKKLK